jgi:hypothetical protein
MKSLSVKFTVINKRRCLGGSECLGKQCPRRGLLHEDVTFLALVDLSLGGSLDKPDFMIVRVNGLETRNFDVNGHESPLQVGIALSYFFFWFPAAIASIVALMIAPGI